MSQGICIDNEEIEWKKEATKKYLDTIRKGIYYSPFEEIICGKSFPGVNYSFDEPFYDMKYIADFINQPKEMIPLPPIMPLSCIPLRLAEVFKLDNVVDRWIVAIKRDKGEQSFYISPAFERDVVSADAIRYSLLAHQRRCMVFGFPFGTGFQLEFLF